eukprot:gene11683-24465_t
MTNEFLSDLLDETISLAVEDGMTTSIISFSKFIREMLPDDVLESLEAIMGDDTFLEDIWYERFSSDLTLEAADIYVPMGPKVCEICERTVRLTLHHLYPRETHKTLMKRGYSKSDISETISICRMCHSTTHRFFTNDELSDKYYSIDLLLNDERFFKYARWAGSQANFKNGKVR